MLKFFSVQCTVQDFKWFALILTTIDSNAGSPIKAGATKNLKFKKVTIIKITWNTPFKSF